ncbi:MarR family transcriptional regulator [Novosphingobium pentaromativorans]|uniref:MarR family transcriptional regulator n=1 Tax=Novosphingobium pentaromativorans TaxID=205844 RepID=UPI00110FC95D|nr:MarR family transcriptional regulator [Novosphingobium pentaromativorans]
MFKIREIVNSLLANSAEQASDTDSAQTHLGDDPAASAKKLYAFRRKRDVAFDSILFGEPGWDILLDLYVATVQDRRISISSACIGAAVPATTALRWVNLLVERGMIERYPDPVDARRSFLRLSHDTLQKMDTLFAGAKIMNENALGSRGLS